MSAPSSNSRILVAGGGIGGIAAALALVRRGFVVKVLEQTPQLGEIGAGLQVGPNGSIRSRRNLHELNDSNQDHRKTQHE